MQMIERVARAMCDGKWDAKDFTETANGESPEEQREYWLEKAKNAIETMREPTDYMLAKGEDTPIGQAYCGKSGAKAVWENMIDMALATINISDSIHEAFALHAKLHGIQTEGPAVCGLPHSANPFGNTDAALQESKETEG